MVRNHTPNVTLAQHYLAAADVKTMPTLTIRILANCGSCTDEAQLTRGTFPT